MNYSFHIFLLPTEKKLKLLKNLFLTVYCKKVQQVFIEIQIHCRLIHQKIEDVLLIRYQTLRKYIV